MDWSLKLAEATITFKYLSSKVLLYCTGNYIQSLGIDTMMEDNIRKGMYIHIHIYTYLYIYIYMTGSLCYIAEIGLTLQSNYT